MDRREHGRLLQEAVTSNVGRVIDLSAGGMRVAAHSTPLVGSFLNVTIDCLGTTVDLRAELVWVRKSGWFRREAGYRFIDVSPEAQRALAELASFGRARRSI